MIDYMGNCGANLPKITRVGLILGSFLPSESLQIANLYRDGEGCSEMVGCRASQVLLKHKRAGGWRKKSFSHAERSGRGTTNIRNTEEAV